MERHGQQSEPYGKPTLISKLGLTYVFIYCLGSALMTLVLAPFKYNYGAASLFKAIVFDAIRTSYGKADILAMQWLTPTTSESYQQFSKKQGFDPDTVILDDGSKAHWIGDRSRSKYTLVYFHGGGYNLPAASQLFSFIIGLHDAVKSQVQEVATVVLAYDLAPYAQYPVQLRQAANLMKYLLEEQNKNPSNIVIAGDSAGGNLAMAIVSHLMRPNPDISIPKINLQGPIKALILISPWSQFDQRTPSFEKNKHSDILGPEMLKKFGEAFCGTSRSNAYLEPAKANSYGMSENWWTPLSPVVSNILITGGGKELLIDGIRLLASEIEKCHENATLMVFPEEAHEEMITDVMMQFPAERESYKAIKSWIQAKLL